LPLLKFQPSYFLYLVHIHTETRSAPVGFELRLITDFWRLEV